MEISNTFEVAAPLAQSWSFLFTPDRVIPCMPGAELVEVKDDGTWVVKAKVKLGPVTMNYKGQVTIVEKDEAGWRVVMSGSGTETRGKGRVKADIVAQLAETDGGGTRAEIVSTIKISGKAAQFGRGMIADVAARFTKEFAEAMEYELAADAERDASAAAERAAQAAAEAAAEARRALEDDEDDADDDPGAPADDGAADDPVVEVSSTDAEGAVGQATLDQIEQLMKRAEKAAKRAEKAAKRAAAEAKRAEAEAGRADAASKRAMAAAKKMELAAKSRSDRPVGGVGLVFWALSRAVGRFFSRLFGRTPSEG